MTTNLPKELQLYDDIEKKFQLDENVTLKRMVFSLIYDYYMRVLWEIKDEFELKEFIKKGMGLKMRWMLIKGALINTDQDETIIKWNKTIVQIASIRDSIAHSHSGPSIKDLRNFRELGIEFKTWLVSSVERYSEVKEALTVSDSIWRYNILYVQQINDILWEFGNKPPLIAEDLETRSLNLIMLTYNELPKIQSSRITSSKRQQRKDFVTNTSKKLSSSEL